MNKHTVIVIVASGIIICSIGYSGWNIFASEQIQIKSINEGYFSYFDLINNGAILFCNPLSLPASFKEIRMSMIYLDRNVGVLHFPNVILDGNSEIRKQGEFESEDSKQIQYLALHFDGMYNGVIPSRIDLENMMIVTEIDSQVLGFIPFTKIKQYPGLEFWSLMNNQDTDYNC
ncbi:MAG: hypothetical protein OEM28_03345 [Nitrosopumilus sp.]|nr:hypothetical protein [Nitrosopumilus sp.]MDH3487424.1 hypothetical protein [Nitrosopumilus sp.]